jgi:TM2 domain-containing membrane protein YozV
MTAPTFGKKGAAGGDAIAPRREAFVAAERNPSDRKAESDVFSPARSALRASFVAPQPSNEFEAAAEEPAIAEFEAAEEKVPLSRSLRTAYILWLFLGLAGGHRFYLGRRVTGGVQAAIFLVSLAAVVGFQYYPAFGGLLLSWLWFFVDGLQLKKMHAGVTGQ